MQLSKESYWAKQAAQYDSKINKDIESLLERIRNNIGPSGHVLDVASGTGHVALNLAKHVQHVDAVDIEPNMIAVTQEKVDAKKINNVSLHIQSAYELKFSDEIFDAVVILNSLHVMKTPHLALNEMKRVIKPASFLFAPTYCHAETKESLENYEKWALKSGHKSYHMFTCETLCDLISSCGFCIKEKEVMLINHGGENGVMAIGYIVAIPDS